MYTWRSLRSTLHMRAFPHAWRAKPVREPGFDLVVLVASVGGVQALQTILRVLPARLPAAVAIVQHRRARPPYMLAEILRRSCKLAVKQIASAGEAVQSGTVYVAPPDHHLVIAPDRTLELLAGRRIRHLLSSADPLLESASIVFEGRVLAVVLTGGDGEGTAGVQTVRLYGGVVIAQDEAVSVRSGLPRPAIATECVDYVLPLEEIGPAIERLAEGRCIEVSEVPG
jgi:two-component system, chemotaxis family, protein-glutamate methylesterase/glutaminase